LACDRRAAAGWIITTARHRAIGRDADAAAAYHAAMDQCENVTEKQFLQAQYRLLSRN